MLTTAGVEHGPTRVERHQQSLFETRDQLVAPWQAKPRRSTPQAPNTQMQTEGHRFANHHFVLRGQSDRSVESSLANRSGMPASRRRSVAASELVSSRSTGSSSSVNGPITSR